MDKGQDWCPDLNKNVKHSYINISYYLAIYLKMDKGQDWCPNLNKNVKNSYINISYYLAIYLKMF